MRIDEPGGRYLERNPAPGVACEAPGSVWCSSTLDTDAIAGILGHDGEMSRGVYKMTIGRPDWGVGPAEQLARGLRAALDRAGG